MNNRNKIGLFEYCLIVLLVFSVGWFGMGFVFQALFNWLTPLFWASAPHLSYWEAFGLMVALSIVFGGSGVSRRG